MAQVSNQAELLAALAAADPEIQAVASFSLNRLVDVTYPVVVSGPGTVISRAPTYDSILIRVRNGGALTLENITIDGDKGNHPAELLTNRSLVFVAGGRLHLAAGSALQNNNAYQEGGGVYLSGDAAYSNTLLMDGDARIRGCWSRTSGGGLMVAVRNSADSVTIADRAAIENNEAANGGGAYFRAYLQTAGGAFSIADDVRISGNSAYGYAPGVCNEGTLYTGGLRDLSNGLYIANGGAAARLREALAEGSVIALDNTEYVAPNDAGTPIVVALATPQYPLLTQADADAFRKPPENFHGWEIRLSDDRTQVLLALTAYSLRYENLMGAYNPNPAGYNAITPTFALAEPGPLPWNRFAGWFTPEGVLVTGIVQGTEGDRILYARWEPVLHRMVYYGNDAGGPPACKIPEPLWARHGERVTRFPTAPTRRCYRFTGWNTQPDGSGDFYLPGQTAVAEGDVLLHAQWIPAEPGRPCRCRVCGSKKRAN